MLLHQSKPGLVHQSRRLERMTTALAPQLGRRHAAQFRIHERNKLVGGVRIAFAPGFEQLRQLRA